jgi:hypothetical protein
VEIFNLEKLNKIQGKEKYQVEMSNLFIFLGSLMMMCAHRTLEVVRKNIKIVVKMGPSYNEFKLHNQFFERG